MEKEEAENWAFSDITKRSPLISAKHYTKINIQSSTIRKCLHLLSYKSWLSITKSQILRSEKQISSFKSYEDYRQFCRLHYIEKRDIPTLPKLLNYFGKSVPYTDNILHPLIRAGFTWKELPGAKKALLIEKPEQFQERIQYLQNMKEWRKNHLPILYVEFIPWEDMLFIAKKQCVAFAVSTLTGLVHITFLEPNFRFNKHWLKHWTMSFLKIIINPHVIVLAENKIEYKEVDTELKMTSPKMEMVQWLEYNDIPHNPYDHRAELYRLVQKSRCNCKPKQSPTEKLMSFGHHVVEHPRGIMDLTMVYANIKSKLMSECDIHSNMRKNNAFGFLNSLKEFTLEEWRNIDLMIREREEKIYQEDMEMEAVVDKLMELGKYGRISETETECLDNFTPFLGRNNYMNIIMID